jgi:O-antigen/teichoic acid export membrane protein
VTRLRNNIIANFGGRSWSIVMGLVFVPVYIHILGIEAYGLIGFFLSVQAFFFILDMGLSATLSRELARDTHAGADADDKRDLVRTLEWLYWPAAVVIAIGVFAISEPIAANWLKPVSLSVDRTAHAIVLMGLAAALQWPSGFYSGGFSGLERQVLLNGLGALFATLRNLGAVGVILYVSPTIEAFLWWQVAVNGFQTATYGLVLWQLLPAGKRLPAFRRTRLRELFAFALGMTGIAALGFFLRQSDKVILSTLLPLNEFGYYTLAATVATSLSAVIQPFFNALYPRYSGLVATGNQRKLTLLYHQSNQLLVVLVASIASVLAIFAVDILRLWTHNPVLAARSGGILTVLAIGTSLNGFLNLPYALQLAYGRTRLALYQNILAVVIVVPLTWFLAMRFGGIGAASVWLALNLSYISIGIPLMHRKLLPDEMKPWYRYDVLPPTLAAVAVTAVARIIMPTSPDGLAGVAALSLVGLTALAAAACASSFGLQLIKKYTYGINGTE